MNVVKQKCPLLVQVRFFCNAMPWVDCTALRYHCTKLPDVDLCPEAFADGRFPPGCTARDFVKIDGARTPQVSDLSSRQIMQRRVVSYIRQGLHSCRPLAFRSSMGTAADSWHINFSWSVYSAHTAHYIGSLRVTCLAHCITAEVQKSYYVQESPQDWSDQETLLLLEGMEMYGENWAEIAEHVGTRSQVPL